MASTLLRISIELRYITFDELLRDREVRLSEERNQDRTFNSAVFMSLARTCRILFHEIKSWIKGRTPLPQALYCGIFDPDTTVFRIDLDFLAQHKHLPSFVMGRQPGIQSCTDPTWLRIERAWSDEHVPENIQHLQIDVASLSISALKDQTRDPSTLLSSLFWNHFAKPQKLQRLDIRLDVSQSPYKLDWQSTILADVWVWLGLCKWQVLDSCICCPPRKYPTIRYQDTSSKKASNTWLSLELEKSLAITTFLLKCPLRQRLRDQNFSLRTIIRANKVHDTMHEEWRQWWGA
ncbi:hypothetical protein N431DRAFT_462828 [Stipitochalara longipes BDJ]|nr:hypothetical protein N431DRAFT_462828 [Stipitochalara longipes BDJ]